MTTLQETTNGHRVSPPPGHDATGVVSSDFSNGIPANKLHRQRGLSREPLSPRCQFTFSDGRQCTMARSDIHPSMCPFHAEREEQLFGSPAPGGNVVGEAFDLPELYTACADLTTASGVNRALAQVFRLLAQRRISRQEAATFGHLAQILLRTITLARAESADPIRIGVPSEHRERGTSPEPSGPSPFSTDSKRERHIPANAAPALDISPASSPAYEPVPSQRHNNGASASQPPQISVDSPPPVPPPPSKPPASNSSEINTCENTELKTVQNEHLRETHEPERDAKIPNGPRPVLSSPPPKDDKRSNRGGD